MMPFMPQDYFKMFYRPELFVDVFQETKRSITNRIVLDPVLNKAANSFIDSQTQFAKMLLDNALSVSQHSVNSLTEYWIPHKP